MTATLTRRAAVGRVVAALGAVVFAARPSAQAKRSIVVYKDPSCGCCHQWVKHMQANGFTATVKDVADVNTVKRAHSIAEPLWSCHTAVVGNYVVEGHVPAPDVN